ncbi:HAD family hydrolase [Alicyclobacillus fastidiosus]|uniref:HAD family hydrolase n=1 Tax=Alicyclobacillus fastidiosus TaxID=392011 RepID=A0ABV5AA74_9BACL|nr:HAD family hydrolase [Alicyclobacillus fastidiosus]WEH07680.1 HAD family hydrolase [Alicyclobacillus fastidiosus]
MRQTVVFDFDGTVADTLPICYYAFQQVFRAFDGRQLQEAEIQRMFGPSEAGIIRQNLANQAQVADAISQYYRHYEEKHKDYVPVFAPIRELLRDMKGVGFHIAIWTGKGRQSLDISLRELALNDLFDQIVTGDDVIFPKPHPEGLHFIMQQLKCRSEDVTMVGDSDADIEAGNRANVRSVRVEWFPHASPREFRATPDHVFQEVDQLRRLLGLD